MMNSIKRKTLLYKTGVEYGDYFLNHVLGCYRGYKYPCYAILMAKRFGKIINQGIYDILNSVSFVDKIVFGKLNYNPIVKRYRNYIEHYNYLSYKVIKFCLNNNIEYHIKNGTINRLKNKNYQRVNKIDLIKVMA